MTSADALLLRRLAARLLRPEAAHHDEVAAFVAARAGDTAQVLWEALAAHGHIPAEWPGDRGRQFDSSAAYGLEQPPDLATALALASDPRGVMTVEVLLRDSWNALAPAAHVSVPLIRWRVLPRERVHTSRDRPGRALLADALRMSLPSTPSASPRGQRPPGLLGAARRLMRDLLGDFSDFVYPHTAPIDPGDRASYAPEPDPMSAVFDAAACEEALGFDLTDDAAEAFALDAGAADRWAALRPGEPNPFAALRRIWELGYAVDDVTPDAVLVIAPEGPVPSTAPWSRRVHVAGFSYEGRAAALSTLILGQPVRLEREPENPHDANAVRVVTDDGRHLGYVPRATSATLASLLDADVGHRATIDHVDGDAPSLERAVFVRVTEA